MLIKTIMKYHLTLIRTTSDSLQIINAGEGVQKREPSYTVSGNVTVPTVSGYSYYGEQYGGLTKN